jgi:putative ABC transport system permease protein
VIALSTVAHRVALRAPGAAAVTARRAVVRWAWRMVRREWRQQILVTALLTLAVAAAIGSVTVAYNSGATDDAEHGSANHLIRLDGADPQRLEAGLAAARERFGTTDVIGHRSLDVPGSADPVEFRAQDPRGAYGDARLGLRRGSYPEGPAQVAVTDGVATLLGLEIGDPLALDGRRRSVVGIVENPRKLSDEFALVSPSSAGAPDEVTVLVDASAGAVDAFAQSSAGSEDGQSAFSGTKSRDDNQAADALAMFSVATVFLLLASLVASAGFAVIAQRRLRQLGALAAIGATEKHLRLVLLTNGTVVGAIGALIGAIAGLALWLVLLPTLEPAVDHRIDPLSLPWTLLVAIVLVAVLGAAAAAWWPGRAVARIPVTLALSGRPPRPKPVHHSAIVGAGLIAAGIASLAFSNRDSEPLIIAGILATIIGTLLLAPLAIRIFARAAGHAPIAARLALRDLARYQARSGAALAAITLALGIAAAVVIVSAAEERQSAAEAPNLSDRQIRVYPGGTSDPDLIATQTPAELERAAAGVRRMAAGLRDAAVTPLHNAYQPGVRSVPDDGERVLFTQALSRKIKDPESRPWSGRAITCLGPAGCYLWESRLYVATPALLRYLGVEPAAVDPGTDFLADRSIPTDELVIPMEQPRAGAPEAPQVTEVPVTNVQKIDSRKLFGSPEGDRLRATSFITPNGLRRIGLRQVPSGWMVESSRPLTGDQISAARESAAGAGLTIETQRESDSFATLSAIATAAGALLALGILAMTVGLIRSESASDLRTLTATGAASRTRRTLTATTAGALALLGALLGVAGAYVALAATYLDDLDYLGRIPAIYLVLMVVGVPWAAVAAGWLLSGREPPAIARTAIE